MRLDFSTLPLRNRAFSDRPTAFLDQEAKNFLSAVMDLAAIETGNRAAREFWQKKQLQNLVAHAAKRSPFWRKRIRTSEPKDVRLADLPALSRTEAAAQVAGEGSLVRAGEMETTKHSTSGSTGTPVEFFVTARNLHYNVVRSAAQYFMDGSDMSLNRTRVRTKMTEAPKGFTLTRDDHWIGPLKNFLKTGANRHFDYFRPDMEALCEALASEPIGYLVIHGRFVENIIRERGIDFLGDAGTKRIVPIGEGMDESVRLELAVKGIPSRGFYSAEEFGPIASECIKHAGFYHIVTSNVIVELDKSRAAGIGGKRLAPVLVTGLHYYATPFIRYDIGDLASLYDCCPCGHDGPALSDIYGKEKEFLKHKDGRLTIFHTRAKEFFEIADVAEYRIRQVAYDCIVAEISGRRTLTGEEASAIEALIRKHAGPGFRIELNAVPEIDWGKSLKRLGFKCEV